MKRTILASSIVVLSLAVPVSVGAQRRGGGESGGGSAGGRTSSEPSVGTAQPRSSAPSAPSSPSPSSSSGDRGASPASVRSSSPRTSAASDSGVRSSRAAATSRSGEQRAIRGAAQPRTGPIIRGGSNRDVYFYNYYPWYTGGSHFGYLGVYSPFYYRRAGWGWGGYGYGYWHDPFLYDPYGYYGPMPYYWSQSGSGSSRYDRDEADDDLGSIRLRVNPRAAKVYVDGALAGIVDEFDGLSNHLKLPVGRHQIELRADGYEPVSLDVMVEKGKTRTERASLKPR